MTQEYGSLNASSCIFLLPGQEALDSACGYSGTFSRNQQHGPQSDFLGLLVPAFKLSSIALFARLGRAAILTRYW